MLFWPGSRTMNIKKGIICCLGFVLMLAGMGASAPVYSAAEKPVLRMNTNLLLVEGKSFFQGSFNGTALDKNSSIVLQDKGGQYVRRGQYLSPEIQPAAFRNLVMSWNADTPEGTTIIAEAQLLLDNVWSPWYSWGRWSAATDSGSAKGAAKETFIAMDVDTLMVKNKRPATALRYRITLESASPVRTPAVRLVSVAIQSNERKALPVIANQAGLDVVLDVPPYSQKQRDPKISARICSPTSLSMILNYYGVQVIPEEAAWGVMDYSGDIFGNWPFNCAYAGTFGLRSYVAYYSSLADIRRDILAGRPIAASVRYKKNESIQEKLPVLHNAPIDATEGHLVVVRGFVQKDGKEYVVVNDPAAPDDMTVKRLYLASEFEAAWTKVVYVVAKEDKAVSQPKRIGAKLIYIGDGVKSAGKTQKSKAYLTAAGRTVDMGPGKVRSIVKINSAGKTEFLEPDADRLLRLDKQEKNATIIVISSDHNVYQAQIE